MLTIKQYIEIEAKETPTQEELDSIKEYENEHNITNDASRDSHINSSLDSANNNPPTSPNPITDLSIQKAKELEEELLKKEKAAKYQEEQEKKRNEAPPEKEKSSSNGLLTLVTLLSLFGAVWYFFFKKNVSEGVSDTSTDKKATTTANRAENSNRETEQRTSSLGEVF